MGVLRRTIIPFGCGRIVIRISLIVAQGQRLNFNKILKIALLMTCGRIDGGALLQERSLFDWLSKLVSIMYGEYQISLGNTKLVWEIPNKEIAGRSRN